MKRRFGFFVPVVRALCFAALILTVLGSCELFGKNDKKATLKAPVVTLSSTTDGNGILAEWSPSSPKADSYDVYYAEVAGTWEKLSGYTTPGATIDDLTKNTTYIVKVKANKSKYTSVESEEEDWTVGQRVIGKPGITLVPSNGSITYTISASNPAASAYTVYYRSGTLSAVDVKAGTKISNAPATGTIDKLSNGTTYSFIVRAERSGYNPSYSDVRTATPKKDSDPSKPITPNNGKSPKRGIGYGTNETLRNHKQNMAALGPGTSWVYTWGLTATGDLETACTESNVLFIPMTFSPPARWGWNEAELRTYLTKHPEVEYLLTYNEPMFNDHARSTPQQCAADWPRVKGVARDFNLKIVGPALNWGDFYTGVPGNIQNPKGWFDTFLQQPGVSIDDLHAIAIHTYSGDAKGQKWNSVATYREYNKPIWLTEFCAWEDNWYTKNALHQEKFMSEMIIYLEQEPMIEKYAWFMANGGDGGSTNWPFFNLVNSSGLSRLGTIFVNMSTCDKGLWEPTGKTIAAAHFTANHLSLYTTTGPDFNAQWPGGTYGDFPGSGNNAGTSVHFRPTTDPDASAQVLDVYNFNGNNKWMEYQIKTSSAKNYKLTLRFQTSISTNIQIYVDNMNTVKETVTLNSTNWDTQTVQLGNLTAGNHTIRLKANGGNCALNWLKVD